VPSPGPDTILSRPIAKNQGILSTSAPRSAFLFPEFSTGGLGLPGDDEIFVFQYWPETFEDNYNPEYAAKQIPGGSHPLLQWTGGSGRDITFTAQFSAEIDEGISARGSDFLRGGRRNAAVTRLLPSQRYTVDIRSALNRIRSYMLGDYGGSGAGNINSLASPPKKLYLVLEGTRIGGQSDYILCVLRSAPITYEACFPSGVPRLAQVQMTFSEIVQGRASGGTSAITFIGRSSFESDARYYKYRGSVDRTVGV
jgi:hypothetical protein